MNECSARRQSLKKHPMPLPLRAMQLTGNHAESRADKNAACICLRKAPPLRRSRAQLAAVFCQALRPDQTCVLFGHKTATVFGNFRRDFMSVWKSAEKTSIEKSK